MDQAPEQTGLGPVDDVVRAVSHLEERPVAEHVGVFETAHSVLRQALESGPHDSEPS